MPETPPKLATARPTLYIDVTLAGGQKISFTVETAKELHAELGAALQAIDPPPHRQQRRHNGRKKKATRQNQETSESPLQ